MVSPSSTLHPVLSLQQARKHLARSKQLLFVIAVIGQLFFVLHIVTFYGGIAWNGTYEKVNEKLGHGVMDGDPIGNVMLAVHIFLAAVIMLGGPLQFIGAFRQKFPVFHRWNGRIYYLTAFIISIVGLYMNAMRGAHGGLMGALGNGLNASFIFLFSILAWRTAVRRDFVAHRKWAIRAFVAVTGVWFFRIGYGLWILLTGFTAIGAKADLTGPFDIFLLFAHSLVPLALVELYFWAKASSVVLFKQRVAYFFYFLSFLLVGGVAMAALIFWL